MVNELERGFVIGIIHNKLSEAVNEIIEQDNSKISAEMFFNTIFAELAKLDEPPLTKDEIKRINEKANKFVAKMEINEKANRFVDKIKNDI